MENKKKTTAIFGICTFLTIMLLYKGCKDRAERICGEKEVGRLLQLSDAQRRKELKINRVILVGDVLNHIKKECRK